jgi:gluconolactonase
MLRCLPQRLVLAALAPCAVAGLAQAQEFGEVITQRISNGYAYAEAPAWSRDGYFIWADVPLGKMWKWAPGGKAAPFRDAPDKPIGAAYDAKGSLYLCESGARRLVRIPAKGEPEVLAAQWQGKRLNSPNSVAIRKDGHIYFTDPAFGSAGAKRELDFYGVYRIDPDNKREPLSVIAKPKGRPNGIALSPDGKRLYVAISDERAVYAYDLSPKGEALNERVFLMKIQGVPGGLATDEKGNLYVAAHGVQIYSPEGKLLHTIEFVETPSDMAFGGPEGKLLLVTAGPSVYAVEVPVKGSVQN